MKDEPKDLSVEAWNQWLKEERAVWEIMAVPNRTGVHEDHRFFGCGNYKHCADCGFAEQTGWWNPPSSKVQCEPDKYALSWTIGIRGGSFCRREKVSAND